MYDSPYPWMGSKRRATDLIWGLLGDVDNFVDPCFGGQNILLGRPVWGGSRVETVNDSNGYLCNLWRAIAADPAGLAQEVEWPISELDLAARQRWLRDRGYDLVGLLQADPAYYHLQAAAWWLWGQCASLGDNWCNLDENQRASIPFLSSAGQGIFDKSRRDQIGGTLDELACRLRRVRVLCGDWSRAVAETVTTQHAGLTGVVFDPPYGIGNMTYGQSTDETQVAGAVLRWCRDHWTDPRLRIVYCGYSGGLPVPESWDSVAWRGKGGYQSHDNGNRERERIWYSPACLSPDQGDQLRMWH